MNRACFIDRDGVINKLVDRGNGEFTSPHCLEEVTYYPMVDEAITTLRQLGFKLLVVTNQPGIAYGHMSIYECVRICDAMKFKLRLDEVYPCIFPTTLTDVDIEYKPGSGAIKKLIKKWDIDLTAGNYMIGDRHKDVIAGYRANLTTIYANEKLYEPLLSFEHIQPNYHVKNLWEAAKIIEKLEYERNSLNSK